MRRTKIIITLGPATDSPEMLEALLLAGVNCFRLNMSHAKHEWVRAIVPTNRKLAEKHDRNVGILLDTQGPSIRTGDVASKIKLVPGEQFEFTVKESKPSITNSVTVNYDGLTSDVSEGDTILVDNGIIHMRITKRMPERLLCEVLTEGEMGSRRHINLPGVKVNLPALTEKDLADIAVGAEVGVDFVALSFCREAADLDILRSALESNGSEARIIAKIEDQLAVRNLDHIIGKADLIMVARGDLGIECPMEELPIIQRRIVKRCQRFGKPVIVATHLLESMIASPMPTRAEVTDVANAVFEQADAIMLSGETTTGKYPLKCVEVLDKVASRIEKSGGAGFHSEALLNDTRQKTVAAGVQLANSVPGSKLVVFTRRGFVANYASGQRPADSPIFAFAPRPEVVRKLTLNWGVIPMHLPFSSPSDSAIPDAIEHLVRKNLASKGDKLIIVSDAPGRMRHFDAIQLREVQ